MRIDNDELNKIMEKIQNSVLNQNINNILDIFVEIPDLVLDLLEEREKMQKLLDYQKENLPTELFLTCPNCLREKNILNELYVTHNIIENSYQTIRIKCFKCIYHNTHIYKIKVF